MSDDSNTLPPQHQLSARFKEAFHLAFEAHRRQGRKQKNEPYIGHLMGVTSIVLEAGGDEEMAIAALLHDAVEDQGGHARLEEIRRTFGERVARIVEGCTDAYTIPKPRWLPRKKAYLEHLAEADADTRLVSAADKLHNVRAIISDLRRHGPAVFDRFTGRRDGTLWYYRAVTEALKRAGSNPVVEELDREVGELERLAGGPVRQAPE